VVLLLEEVHYQRVLHQRLLPVVHLQAWQQRRIVVVEDVPVVGRTVRHMDLLVELRKDCHHKWVHPVEDSLVVVDILDYSLRSK